MASDKSIVCQWDNCNIELESALECYNHVKSAHIPTGTLKCQWDDCRVVSSSRCNLTNHVCVHIDLIQGYCHVCNRQFKWRGDYKRHIKKHSAKEQTFNSLVVDLFDDKIVDFENEREI